MKFLANYMHIIPFFFFFYKQSLFDRRLENWISFSFFFFLYKQSLFDRRLENWISFSKKSPQKIV